MNPFLGMIILFCGNFAPAGFALCNGQLLAISQYSALFSLLGTTYGGNGTTTFGLPNFQGRVPIHPGNGPGLSPYFLGQIGGYETNTLTTSNLPPHSHGLLGDSTGSGKEFPGPNHVIGVSTTDKMYSANAPNTTMSPRSIGNTGQGIPVNNLQPYLTVNYCIALVGIFPSRN